MDFEERELLWGIRRKNPAAFERFMALYTKPIYYLAHCILRTASKEDLEECVSDVFLEVWQRIGEFDESRGSLKTFIFMHTKYRALSYLRKNTAEPPADIEELELPGNVDVEQLVIDRQTQEQLLQTIDTFGAVDKELFLRRYFYGEGIEALAQSLGLTRSAVDNRLSRGRKVLKEALSYE